MIREDWLAEYGEDIDLHRRKRKVLHRRKRMVVLTDEQLTCLQRIVRDLVDLKEVKMKNMGEIGKGKELYKALVSSVYYPS